MKKWPVDEKIQLINHQLMIQTVDKKLVSELSVGETTSLQNSKAPAKAYLFKDVDGLGPTFDSSVAFFGGRQVDVVFHRMKLVLLQSMP